jgi:truncated hemoglobin YjbI
VRGINPFEAGPERTEAMAAMATQAARRLDLDDAQREKLMAVVEKSHLRIKTIRKRITPELVEIFRDAGVEISSFLNPEQKEEFQAMVRRQRDHFIKGKPLEP